MATAHQSSVITNSCVKPPINPKTGLSCTQDERAEPELSATWGGRDADFMDGLEDPEQLNRTCRSVNFDTTNTFLDTLPADIADLSDDEFYGRLTDLRAEHKKTLETCEQLYNEKVARGQLMSTFPERSSSPVPVATLDIDYSISSMKARIDELNANLEELRHSYNNMTVTKPPTGRPKKSESLPTNTISRMNGKRAKSGEQYFWKPLSATSSADDLSVEDRRNGLSSSLEGPRTVEEAVSRIHNMWENFSVDDYAPRRSARQRSNSLSRLSTERRSRSADRETPRDEWTPKITIPKPFQMMLREANKAPKKTKAMVELDEKRHNQHKKEEAECQKKFKARPIPAHVYLPLYDEIMEEQERKRRHTKQKCAEMIKSSVKPFKFSLREEEKRKIHHEKHANMWNDSQPTTSFRANPYPAHLFENGLEDRVKEDEEYRRIRIQMRAEELLHASSLPPNMKARGEEYTMGKQRSRQRAERAYEAGILIEPEFKPRVNNSIPDFEELHKQFQKQMCKNKFSREATVCKPFNLRTSSIASSKTKIYDNSFDDTFKENVKPYRNSQPKSASLLSGSLSNSLDSIPAKMTAAAEMRRSKLQEALQREREEDLRRQDDERRRRYRESQLKKEITERVAANDKSGDLKAYTQTKLKEYRASERARKQEYREQLKEINNRVKSRPLLFEQAAERNAKQAAERRYKDTIQRAGLDENFIKQKGSKASSSSLQDEDLENEISNAFSSKPLSRSHSARSASIEQDYSEVFDDPASHMSKLEDTGEPVMTSDVEEDLDFVG